MIPWQPSGFFPSNLIIRGLQAEDENSFLAAHRELSIEGFCFGLGYEHGMLWPEYLQLAADVQRGVNVPDGFVSATLLVAASAGEIVGRVSIRHALNTFLRREGGHIGYCVVPRHRRRGIATRMLRHGLTVAQQHGIEDVLLTCNEDNIASRRTIERCGGKLDLTVTLKESGKRLCQYWIQNFGADNR